MQNVVWLNRIRPSGHDMFGGMALLNVADVSRIAGEAARQESSDLRVTGVTFSAGGGDYVEVLIVVDRCHAAPCQITLGVFRSVSEDELRSEIATQVRRHVRQDKN